ncbi:MAG: YidC/Oxa1 family membrane protein insertase [Clostridia bacterium]|nr:YidC/Oxa1 family membrane protein insertase [Clostridia bacterium]
MNFINGALGYVLRFFADMFGGSFAGAVFFFTLLINLVMIPLSIKSQKSSVDQLRIKPKMDDIRKRYGDDRQKLAEAQQKLYQEENVSMSGGCLPMIIRFALLMCIYSLILSPLTYMSQADKTKVQNVTTAFSESMTQLKKEDESKYNRIVEETSWNEKNTRNELSLIRLIRENPAIFEDVMSEDDYAEIKDDLDAVIAKDKESGVNYEFLGMDLTLTPKFNINIFEYFEAIWLIPILAFLAQMLTSVISMFINKKNNPEAPTMAGMMLTMPLISLFLGFTFPGGVGFYWICSSLIGGLIQSGIQLLYGPNKLLAKNRSKELKERYSFEKKQLEKFNNPTVEE